MISSNWRDSGDNNLGPARSRSVLTGSFYTSSSQVTQNTPSAAALQTTAGKLFGNEKSERGTNGSPSDPRRS
ncbi:hypothetical protein EYF80_025117 [Liparis tanakae]|uniref:Uncharacterized protein n=1 Tax=Liparis tanakae TaxID=230148 RepID=A0A4Z2HFF6_9TELE|nr:hypothetical protein EYF80_025117 [Liparis tanakae]